MACSILALQLMSGTHEHKSPPPFGSTTEAGTCCQTYSHMHHRCWAQGSPSHPKSTQLHHHSHHQTHLIMSSSLNAKPPCIPHRRGQDTVTEFSSRSNQSPNRGHYPTNKTLWIDHQVYNETEMQELKDTMESRLYEDNS